MKTYCPSKAYEFYFNFAGISIRVNYNKDIRCFVDRSGKEMSVEFVEYMEKRGAIKILIIN